MLRNKALCERVACQHNHLECCHFVMTDGTKDLAEFCFKIACSDCTFKFAVPDYCPAHLEYVMETQK